MNILKKGLSFLGEVRAELEKVSWSTREEIMGSTVVVIVLTFLIACLIFMMDYPLSQAVRMLYR